MSDVVSFGLGDGSVVRFEAVPGDGFVQASSGPDFVGLVEAVRPAVAAAGVVADQVRELAPDECVVKFGVKVGGETGFLVAKGTAEASFEVTLSWKSEGSD